MTVQNYTDSAIPGLAAVAFIFFSETRPRLFSERLTLS
jgi:hypothetical protein